jgi:hypothetical protein
MTVDLGVIILPCPISFVSLVSLVSLIFPLHLKFEYTTINLSIFWIYRTSCVTTVENNRGKGVVKE